MRSQLDTLDVLSLLAVDYAALDMKVKASNILNHRIEYGMLLGQPLGAGEITGYYYGTIAYSHLTTQKKVQKIYADGAIYVTVEDFSILAFKVLETFLEFTSNDRSAWIIPARFCCIRFVTDCRYLREKKSTKIHLCTQP